MAFNYGCLILQRVVLPTVLVLSALYRPVGISFVYLLMFFISPFIPVATKNNFKGSIPAYLLILVALSTILLLCHAALTVALIALKITLSDGCTFTAKLLRHIGFVDFGQLSFFAIVEWFAPEVLVFLTSLVVYFVVKRLTTVKSESQLENGEITLPMAESTHTMAAVTTTAAGSSEITSDAPVTNLVATATPAGSISIPGTRQTSGIGPYLSLTRLNKIGPFFSCVALFFAAILRPSLPGGFYFLMFLLSGSYWAAYQPLKRGFTLILRLVMLVIIIHVLCIVATQTLWIQEHLNKDSLLARLLGLEPLILSSCETDIRIITYNTDYKLDSFLNPISLLLAYYTLAVTDKEIKRPRIAEKPPTVLGQPLENSNHKFNRQLSLITQTTRGSKKDSKIRKQRLSVSIRRDQQPQTTAIEPNERTPLVREFHHKPRTKSETVTTPVASGAGNVNDIQMESLNDRSHTEEVEKASFCEQLSYGFLAVGGFIYQNSYIFTNILMMVWSIVYHSWLTFVLLLWANVLWMIPNQRKAMMRSSPFVVMYAELLVIAQYVYGMNLRNDELPSTVATQGINLKQIGFERPQENGVQPCVPLLVKTSFLLMFWITLRQFCKEKREKHRQTTIADIFAPLQLGVVGAGHGQYEAKKTSKFLKAAGEIIKNLLVRLWMWLLVLVIFLCAITGGNMTGFRICYMALFLFFLLVFQSSSKAWVKIMYGFWLFLIFYAMSILTLIYTYQFDKFDQYWYKYLNISQTLQSDIGLERYQTKDLFLHLLSPTIIVILTVIQVHYFHRRFIASLQQQEFSTTTHNNKTRSKKTNSESHSGRAVAAPPVDETEFKKSLFNLIRISFKKARSKVRNILKNFKSVFWRFLELHVIKAVYIAAFVCSASEVCLLHVAFLGLCLLGAISHTGVQTFISRIISFIVTMIVLVKMIYQVAYLDHERYNVTCDFTNETANNAVWVGLEKSSPETGGLMGLLKKYIIYMVIATLHAVVTLRQRQMRNIMRDNNPVPPKVLFPNVKRADAERDLKGLIQYLFNFGFYKFGLEISLIALVANITFRQDIIAIFYALWLFVLLCIDRTKCDKIWVFFQSFIAIGIFVQYLVYLALPPNFCIEYPWITTPYSEALQQWALLPGDLHISHVSKLYFDFILLLIVVRQKRVFYIESKNPNYEGGNNRSVVSDIASLGSPTFVNPTFDFCSHTRNYSDIVKSIVLRGFFWFTLAVVFLAGTNISDILALGYLIGAFIFLWQGSDFYLRPINTILTRWNWLLTYNMANILFKTCMQLAGCVFINTLREHCCWLVHLLGITCGSTTRGLYRNDNDEPFGPDECPRTSTTMILLWDAICFAFIIFQMRVFKSHYFCHIIIDTKANNILASRGADIIEGLRQKQFQRRQMHEKQILLKIKRKMEKIRATQQKMFRPLDRPLHYDAQSRQFYDSRVPLARDDSFVSCQGSGYQTPVDRASMSSEDSAKLYASYVDAKSESNSSNELISTVKPNTLNSLTEHNVKKNDVKITMQPNTPSSENLTLPFDGYLEGNRLSFGSAYNSELSAPDNYRTQETQYLGEKKILPRSDQYLQPPVKPPRSNLSLGSSGMTTNTSNESATNAADKRRESSTNAVSWNETVFVKCTPKSSETMQNIKSVEYGMPIPGAKALKKKEIKLHPEDAINILYGLYDSDTDDHSSNAVRAGDYYMFEDIDDKFELDMLQDEDDLMEDNDNITESEIKMQRRKTLYDVWKDINCSDIRRELFVRQRSYASAPSSSVGMKLHEQEFEDCTPDGIQISIRSEPFDYACYYSTNSIDISPSTKTGEPTTSKEAQKSMQRDDEREPEGKVPERKSNIEADSVDLTVKDSDEDIEANPIVRLMAAFLVSLTIRLNRFSRNYRYVNQVLTEEKKTLKESDNLMRLGQTSAAALFRYLKRSVHSDDNEEIHMMAQSTSSPSSTLRRRNVNRNSQDANNLQQQPLTTSTTIDELNTANTTDTTTPSTTQLPHSPTSQIQASTPPTTTTTNTHDLNEQPDNEQQLQHLDEITELPLDTVDARKSETSLPVVRSRRKSEGFTEIRIKVPSIVGIHHLHHLNGSGTLSKQWSCEKVSSMHEFPLESEDFASRDHNIIIEVIISAWYALLANTDLICYIVVFINQVTTASVITLPLPIMVFLWGTLSLPRPTKTFWVTLIAYTQAIVFIKCVFQYKLIWANYVNLPNQPLAPAKIFGVELNPNYAVYDLLLLFVLFFHRFILKSQGLWKSSYKEIIYLQSAAGSETDDNNIRDQQQQIVAEVELDKKSSALSTPLHQADELDAKSISSESPEYIKGINKLKRAKYLSSLRKFFFNLMHKSRLPTDVYALMFLCDFINFFVLLFGFTAFGSQAPDEGDDGGVQTYLTENKVPVPFLIMLLVQFMLIVIDRALYLRKALVNKIIFHFLSVIGIHIWMFFVVPLVTERSFYSLAPPIIFYIFKCFYMLLSSYQIKSGYPKRILGNFLTKGFSMINMILFRVYMLIPLLYELRSVLDWVCTDTTMTIFDWLKMEDIFSNIYFIRCTRQMEKDFPAVRAQKKATYMKLIMGGTIILIIVFFIWGPLCIFALNKTVGQSNVPFEVSQSIRIGPYESIYSTTNRERIFVFNEAMYTQMKNAYIKKKSALSFLTSYDATDIAAVKMAGNSPALWNISPPDKQRFLDDLKNNKTLSARFSYSFDRKPPEKKATGHISSEVVFDLDANFTGRDAMIRMLEGQSNVETVMIPQIVPKFVKIINSGELSIIFPLMPNTSEEYRPLLLQIHSENNSLWWEIRDYCDDEASLNVLNKLPMVDCTSGIIMYTFNDKMFPSTFSFLTAGGIIGVYTTIVLLASRVLRSFISEQYRKIMFQDLPYVDRVLQLCLDIYLVREALEFALEEDLFAKLIFLYRSPETMIKWTRPKEEYVEEETDSESGRSRRQ